MKLTKREVELIELIKESTHKERDDLIFLYNLTRNKKTNIQLQGANEVIELMEKILMQVEVVEWQL